MLGILTMMVSLLLVQAVMDIFRQFYIKGKGLMNIKGKGKGFLKFLKAHYMVACQDLRGSCDPRGREG